MHDFPLKRCKFKALFYVLCFGSAHVQIDADGPKTLLHMRKVLFRNGYLERYVFFVVSLKIKFLYKCYCRVNGVHKPAF